MADFRANYTITKDGKLEAREEGKRFTWGSTIYIHNESSRKVTVDLYNNRREDEQTGLIVAPDTTFGWCPIPLEPTSEGNWGVYYLSLDGHDFVPIELYTVVLEGTRVLPGKTTYLHGGGHTVTFFNATGRDQTIRACDGSRNVTRELFKEANGDHLTVPAAGFPHLQVALRGDAPPGAYLLTLQSTCPASDADGGPAGPNDGGINVGDGPKPG
jgi:hypothetical protein